MNEREKREVYNAWREGELTEAQARDALEEDWKDVLQLARIEDILANQPDPDTDKDLFKE